ncbi:MAG: methylated-DNA--[protein]-cysteine S-methyltransferase [Gammaproteobacteria bacterium]|nr:methylated-DNA--[protein]-cysteine S-methyltransferase [Gammaproteobacteria bacterium]MCY4274270.1 methylated-DNA--[protein]-cysteine S-methyltransferase [Gammaproteobacteria bacterium]
MKILNSSIYPGPIGNIRIVMDLDTLVFLDFEENIQRCSHHLKKRYVNYSLREVPCPQPIQTSFDAYFAGELDVFKEIKIDPSGTLFQKAVWDALQRIPAGESRSYSRLATEIGKPRAARAVGSANANNPISIMIPCHRVINQDGQLSGYAGGTDRQRWLLEHEGALSLQS